MLQGGTCLLPTTPSRSSEPSSTSLQSLQQLHNNTCCSQLRQATHLCRHPYVHPVAWMLGPTLQLTLSCCLGKTVHRHIAHHSAQLQQGHQPQQQ